MPVQPWSELMSTWLEPFRSCFTGPTFRHVLVLVTGAILTPARRTITAMLSVVGLSQAPTFTNYHRVLNRNRWCSREVARRLLRLLVTAFMPAGPVIIALDDTLERRWGARIKARGIYRDPVRSSHGHFVKASGLRWLSFMLLAPIPWADRVWALPFFTLLAPSERYARERRRRHKTLTDWAHQALLQIARWLPERRIIAVADSSFAAIALLSAVCERVCMITRLRLDARLFEPPPPRTRGTMGRPRILASACQRCWSAWLIPRHRGSAFRSAAGTNSGLLPGKERPELQRQVREQPSLLPTAIDEILRIHAPLIANRRITTGRWRWEGGGWRPGARISLIWASANRDEAVFGDPDEFRLDRDPAQNLLYGAGNHVCPGRRVGPAGTACRDGGAPGPHGSDCAGFGKAAGAGRLPGRWLFLAAFVDPLTA